MMNIELLKKIRKIALIALFADDELMNQLVLKGGSAIDLVYGLSKRGSIDLDFSIESDFNKSNLDQISIKMEKLLKREFRKNDYMIFDFEFETKPKNNFDLDWGGYKIEFKLIETDKYDGSNLDQTRRESMSLDDKYHKKFTIDISKHEYTCGKIEKEIEGYIIYVYTINLIIVEKIRAICQQNPEYKEIIKSATTRSRAKDFYDIYILLKDKNIGKFIDEIKDTIKSVFKQKKVPLEYLMQISNQKNIHKADFASLRDTLPVKEKLEEFDIYFEFIVELCRNIYKSIFPG